MIRYPWHLTLSGDWQLRLLNCSFFALQSLESQSDQFDQSDQIWSTSHSTRLQVFSSRSAPSKLINFMRKETMSKSHNPSLFEMLEGFRMGWPDFVNFAIWHFYYSAMFGHFAIFFSLSNNCQIEKLAKCRVE